jgi:DNA gyrase subunit A
LQVALVDGVPRTLTLKACLQHFLDFRLTTIQRRARHRLGKAQARLHLVEGLLQALGQLDAVVQVGAAAAASYVCCCRAATGRRS